LGKFNIESGQRRFDGLRAKKVQELFSYLLLYNGHPQSRESLSELLWGDAPPDKSKKNLRQTLWQLQTALKEDGEHAVPVLVADDEWIQIVAPHDLWLDVAEFEEIYNLVIKKRARELTADDMKAMQYAVGLYRGHLLEGWYQEWCVFERERFQMMNLALLDKLVQYCEIHHHLDAGLAYGQKILQFDRAYERTHRQMMRLYYMAGDRTQAIHQYERCVAALREELDVDPSERTRQLYQQICTDTFKPPLYAFSQPIPDIVDSPSSLKDVLARLVKFTEILSQLEGQVEQDLNALESMMQHK
jgi:DNA-binding SARP family transcriptional activator